MFTYLEKRGLLFWVFTGPIFLLIIGAADTLTGSELSFALFYLIPIFLVTWFSGRNFGIALSIASAVMWFVADVLSGQSYSEPIIRYWNALVRLGFFVVITLLLPSFQALEREKGLARTDDLTGIPNRRHFFELAQKELERSQRYNHTLTVAYIDLDNFKIVNDQHGHKAGDKLLRTMVALAKSQLRKTDIIARLGGDEFVLMLPETDQEAAMRVLPKIQKALSEEMQHNSYSVTFSIGVLTCIGAQISLDELIKRADGLMYSVKKNGKDGVRYEVCMD